MKKILVFEKRKKARELRKKGWSLRKIANALVASKGNVLKWINMAEKEVLIDNRGWQKGKLRKHNDIERERIIAIRKQLEKEGSYFIGELVVQKNYENLYGEKLERWFVNKVLREGGLSKKRIIKKKGKSKYMKYPMYTLNRLGKILMSIDFIGPKYLKGGRTMINFLSCKYIRPKKIGVMERIEGQTTNEVIKVLSKLWTTYPMPDVLKVDNDTAFGANHLHKNSIGRLTIFLLNLGISPLYVAPRSPWNNGEVEGFNSVFSKKFWNKLRFENEEEIDIEIRNFNLEYEKYSNLIANNPETTQPRYIKDYNDIDLKNKQVNKFRQTKIYFLRIVRRKGEKEKEDERGFIDIVGEEISLGKDLINLFTFSIIDINEGTISINIEEESGKLQEIKRKNFQINNIIRD